MSARLTIDSSVFLSSWQTNEVSHQHSLAFFNTLNNTPVKIAVPDLAIFELSNVLTRIGLNCRPYLDIFDDEWIELVPLSEELHTLFVKLASKAALKTSDLIFCATAKLTHSTLISWDRRLLREASKVVNALTPLDYVRAVHSDG
jgi:predicted nucleic acid-binding protein